MEYKDISPSCVNIKPLPWSKTKLRQEGVYYPYLQDRLPKGVKLKNTYLSPSKQSKKLIDNASKTLPLL